MEKGIVGKIRIGGKWKVGGRQKWGEGKSGEKEKVGGNGERKSGGVPGFLA